MTGLKVSSLAWCWVFSFTLREDADALDATERLADRSEDLAGRGEAWVLASADNTFVEPFLSGGGTVSTLDRSDIVQALAWRGSRGHWLTFKTGTNDVIEWRTATNVASAILSVLRLANDGTGQLLEWTVNNASSDACYRYALIDGSGQLAVDDGCDGVMDSVVAATIQPITELPPTELV